MSKQASKRQQKKQLLVERTARALSVAQDEAERLLSITREQSVRVNSLLLPSDDKAAIKETYRTFAWYSDGLHVDGEQLEVLKNSSLVSEGKLYIQNAASWIPVLALDPKATEQILDMCAAPGGKTSHIAQLSRNQAHIIANDNSKPRLHKLESNLARMGASSVECTLFDATQLSRHFPEESFDKILLDAPCSGEGMMTLTEDKLFDSWSVAHIKRLQQLQKRLIVQAWRLLKPGGTLVYSTCTIAPDENEAVVDYLLRHNENATIVEPELFDRFTNRSKCVLNWNDRSYAAEVSGTLRLAPSNAIEAFYVAVIKKAGHS